MIVVRSNSSVCSSSPFYTHHIHAAGVWAAESAFAVWLNYPGGARAPSRRHALCAACLPACWINKDLSFRTPTRAALLNFAVVLNYISIQLVVQTAFYAPAPGLHSRKSAAESEFALVPASGWQRSCTQNIQRINFHRSKIMVGIQGFEGTQL